MARLGYGARRSVRSARGHLSPGFRRPRRVWPKRVGAAFAALALGAGGAWAWWEFRVLPAASVPIQIKTLEFTATAEAWVVRDEHLVSAPAAGQVQHLIAEGDRARAGAAVVSITPAGGAPIQMPATAAGIASYSTDGLEEALSPGQSNAWKPSWLKGLPAQATRALGEGAVAAGQPVFKLINNFEQSLLLLLDTAQTPSLQPNEDLQLRLGASKEAVPVTIAQVVTEGRDTLLHLTIQSLPRELTAQRRAPVTLLFAVQTGKAVPRSAIDVRGGLQGVWRVEGSERRFVPVRVIGGNAADVILETDLPPGSTVLKQAPLDPSL